eukprot:scaffold141737_cov36-Tisochrysis_lutea.AAC.1
MRSGQQVGETMFTPASCGGLFDESSSVCDCGKSRSTREAAMICAMCDVAAMRRMRALHASVYA